MGVDIHHRQFHKGRHADDGFHIVGEYKESGTCSTQSAVQSNTVHYCCHGELRHTCMEKCSREITGAECRCLLQECVGLVAVCKVGRRYYNVVHLLAKHRKHIGRRGTSGDVWLVGYRLIIDIGQLAGEESLELDIKFRICFSPKAMSFLALGRND